MVVQLAVPVVVNSSPPTGQVMVLSMGIPAHAELTDASNRKVHRTVLIIAEPLRSESDDS
jgi:hypothetical protein